MANASRFRPLLRRLWLVGLLVAVPAALVAVALAQPSTVVVEDWSTIPVGTRGIPPGWQGHNWGSPKYDFTVIQDGNKRALLLKSDNDSSSISKEIKVDAKQYPILEWRWKVVTLPPKGDARKAETDDEAAQLYVTFPRFPTAVRSRIIGYIWDSTEPVGRLVPEREGRHRPLHRRALRQRRPRQVDHGDAQRPRGLQEGLRRGARRDRRRRDHLHQLAEHQTRGRNPSSARSCSRSPDRPLPDEFDARGRPPRAGVRAGARLVVVVSSSAASSCTASRSTGRRAASSSGCSRPSSSPPSPSCATRSRSPSATASPTGRSSSRSPRWPSRSS